MRPLDVVKPFLAVLPEIEPPERRVPFRQKAVYTAVALFVFLVCSQLPLYGIKTNAGSDPFYWARVIMASNRCAVGTRAGGDWIAKRACAPWLSRALPRAPAPGHGCASATLWLPWRACGGRGAATPGRGKRWCARLARCAPNRGGARAPKTACRRPHTRPLNPISGVRAPLAPAGAGGDRGPGGRGSVPHAALPRATFWFFDLNARAPDGSGWRRGRAPGRAPKPPCETRGVGRMRACR